MLCLMRNDQARKKLLDEIDEGIKAETIPTGSEEVVRDSEARQFTYLQAVIKEVCSHRDLPSIPSC